MWGRPVPGRGPSSQASLAFRGKRVGEHLSPSPCVRRCLELGIQEVAQKSPIAVFRGLLSFPLNSHFGGKVFILFYFVIFERMGFFFIIFIVLKCIHHKSTVLTILQGMVWWH